MLAAVVLEMASGCGYWCHAGVGNRTVRYTVGDVGDGGAGDGVGKERNGVAAASGTASSGISVGDVGDGVVGDDGC
jgi:hypothetical protein